MDHTTLAQLHLWWKVHYPWARSSEKDTRKIGPSKRYCFLISVNVTSYFGQKVCNYGNLKFRSLNLLICLIPIFLSEHPGAMRLNLFMSEPKQMVFQSARNLEDNGLWNLNGSYRPLHHSQNTRKRERGQRGSEAITVLKLKGKNWQRLRRNTSKRGRTWLLNAIRIFGDELK